MDWSFQRAKFLPIVYPKQVPQSATTLKIRREKTLRQARAALVMDGTLGGMLAGAPLLPRHAAPLNATDPEQLLPPTAAARSRLSAIRRLPRCLYSST